MQQEAPKHPLLEIKRPFHQTLIVRVGQGFEVEEKRVIVMFKGIGSSPFYTRIKFFAPANLPIVRRGILEDGKGVESRSRLDDQIVSLAVGLKPGEEVFLDQDSLWLLNFKGFSPEDREVILQYRSAQPVKLCGLSSPEEVEKRLRQLSNPPDFN